MFSEWRRKHTPPTLIQVFKWYSGAGIWILSDYRAGTGDTGSPQLTFTGLCIINIAFLILKTYNFGKALILLVYVTKAYRKSTKLFIINIDNGWRRVFSFTPRPLYSCRNNVSYRFNRRISGPQSQSGQVLWQIRLFPCRESNPGPSSQYLLLYSYYGNL